MNHTPVLPVHEHDPNLVKYLVTVRVGKQGRRWGVPRYCVYYQFELRYELLTYVECGWPIESVERVL